MLLTLVEFLLLSKKGSRIQAVLQGPALTGTHYKIIARRDRDISIPQFPFLIDCRCPSGGNEIFPQIYRCT